MRVKRIRFNEEENLELIGVNEKGKEELTYIAIPPAWETRIDIIISKNLKQGYVFGCEEDVIIIKASKFGNQILWAPLEVIVEGQKPL